MYNNKMLTDTDLIDKTYVIQIKSLILTNNIVLIKL